MLRRTLLFASRNDQIRNLVSTMPATRSLVPRFVAGETDELAVQVGSTLVAEGLRVTFNSLGEYVDDPSQAAATRDDFVGLARRLSDSGLSGPAYELSVKLSALGLLSGGHAVALEHAQAVCAAADKAGILVTLDMEDHTTTDSTLETARALRRDFPDVGVVIQAALHRSPADCADFARAGARVRLVKGAYREPRSVALQRRSEVDLAYVRCLRELFHGSAYPMVATHDPRLLRISADMARRDGRGTDSWEYQMLLGVREAEQRRLVAAGYQVRVYLPFGPQWYGYLLRRLAERPANLMFLLRALARNDAARRTPAR